MSTDFIALFDITSDAVTPESLLANLSADTSFAAEIIERYRDHWQPKAWTIETSPATGEPEILAPGGFALRFASRTLDLYHMMPFGMFTGDVWSREAMRRACYVVAQLVGSPRAIYTHELMPYGSDGLDNIEKTLLTQIGPPAGTFEELREADYFGPRAWYVDSFADLQKEADV
jgi:hypothetical protein